jgi:hypothetical protein
MSTVQTPYTMSFDDVVVEPLLPPIIECITVHNGAAIITWSSIIGSTYRLQSKSSPNDANWNDIAPDIIATTNSISATNALGTSQTRFYRVFQVQ